MYICGLQVFHTCIISHLLHISDFPSEKQNDTRPSKNNIRTGQRMLVYFSFSYNL